MNTRRLHPFLAALLSLTLAACSPASAAGQAQHALQQGERQVLQAIESALPPAVISRLPGGTPDAATADAIKQVIQKGNQEQEQAIAARDSSPMKDTSTDAYYQQVSKVNQSALQAGVTSIKLLKIDFGEISVHGSTATATTTETWATSYGDGTTDQETDRNVYTLVRQNGAWKIQADDQPDNGDSGGAPAPGGASPGGSAGAAGAPGPGRSGSAAPAAPAPSGAAPAITAPSGSPEAAIQQVIVKGDQEQEQAIASHDSTVMKDTSTDSYYQDLAQTNQDMLNEGVTAIKLVGLDWGQVTVNGSSATASNFETWWTQYSDGSTDQQRDRNVYTLVQQNGVWKVDSDDHPDSGLGSGPGGGSPSPQASGSPAPAPAVPPASAAPAGRGQSINWAGYVASGGTFTSVTGTWTVPQLSNAGAIGADAAWVGIGGQQSRDLIQAGTEETILSSGRMQYDAWIEMLPQYSHPIPLGIHPGDSVTVTIKEVSDGSWNIAFSNNTTGGNYERTVQYTSSRSSADWVEEAPSAGRGGVMPLDNFGSIAFSKASAVKDGNSVNLSQAGASPITMINGNRQPLVTPSALTADGSGFTVTRTSNPTTAGQGRRRSG